MIQKFLKELTISCVRNESKDSVNGMVQVILNLAEYEARSGRGRYFIVIERPSDKVVQELERIGLAVLDDDSDSTCRVSWYKDREE